MPDGIPPFVSPPDSQPNITLDVIIAARTLFALHHNCLVSDVEFMLADNPGLQSDFDRLMDEVACDPLTDDCTLGVADITFIHLSDIGLVNAAPVKVVPGVGIIAYNPYQRDRFIAAKGS